MNPWGICRSSRASLKVFSEIKLPFAVGFLASGVDGHEASCLMTTHQGLSLDGVVTVGGQVRVATSRSCQSRRRGQVRVASGRSCEMRDAGRVGVEA